MGQGAPCQRRERRERTTIITNTHLHSQLVHVSGIPLHILFHPSQSSVTMSYGTCGLPPVILTGLRLVGSGDSLSEVIRVN
jgi:hypothetical protein